ncbi:ABC transporter ATP-binding protein [Nodosilinea sp. LEGE 06152]|uniref:ABC transporter ATP-binding protein n=1 Tax=Nodosilinea sp. LEGE 06152 TaxID=2777966 RepID=UPI001880D20B|nr:ABC transporter ATP-binding protein [Nodosilinea sp. LEGE 06152]MBE9158368.1 ABC transporter ATP-binding protein [Nodosilinea sp. LEGE 06152]
MSANHLILNVARKSPLWFLLSIVFGLSGAIFNGIGITLIIPLMLDLLGQDILRNTDFPPLLNSLFSIFDGVSDDYRPLALMALLLVALLFKNLANYGGTAISSLLSRDYVCNLRRDGLRLLLDVDLDYYANVRLGDLMNYLNTEVNRVATAVRTLARIATLIVTILVFLAILMAISWQLTLVSALLMATVALANQVSINQAKVFGQELSSAAAALSNRLIEVLSGIRLVKTTANEDREYAIINRLVDQREEAEFKSQLVFASIGPVNEMLSIMAFIALIIVGRSLFASQLETFSSIILIYLVVLFRMLPFIGQLNSSRSQFASNVASTERLDAFLNRSDKPFMASGHRPFSQLSEGIRFNHISFRYPQGDRWALQEVDLTLPRGQTLALVGSSGAGKSTLADLLPRFYDPSSGAIEIDGIDLKEFDIRAFRRRVGVVSQDTFLFNASVKDNICYGYPEASEAEVIEAARRANAEEFILKLPQGYDTPIGDRGVMLSGGQRQRLAIARALVQNPEILILDEATSALDTVSERLVQQAIDELSQNRTTLVIAHRLSTVHRADQIAVLDHGRVVEVGTHRELLARGQHYAKLHAMQFAEQPAVTP